MTQPRPKIDDPLNAFCKDTDAYLEGAADGPLSGLTFAAKDIFDVAGHVTGGGNPDWKATHQPAGKTAWVVQVLVDAGATMVGKTLTDELTRGIFGENAHYGTPVNPNAPGRVPGGSSSGSASAVAGGLVDFALGSDTGGSVRVPASFCGLYGLRPTHGRIPLDGILIQAPSYDTIGWFARDPETFARVGQILLQNSTGSIVPPRPRRLVIAQDAFEVADKEVVDALQPVVDVVASLIGASTTERLSPAGLSGWPGQQQVLQGREAWETVRDWLDRTNPRFSFEVTERYVTSRAISDEEVQAAKTAKMEVVERMKDVLSGDTVVCLPTTASPAPPTGQRTSARNGIRQRNSSLCCIAGTTGGPQINLPLAQLDGLPVGLSLLGPPGSDEALIGLAREVAAAMQG
ncbi:MAG: amidase [Chloroflexi bacterium]|nr:amidase [Chloroflexota bacterium]MCH8351921.1 amidase [Chloroflexota bacterium]MCI0859164.1 amidase [Chloroflexota bacterium]MCI0866777.1 amidase [Chloroflexota bacterium]MCI0877902.1 amidase [Chloroflexota bacterium]